MCCYLVDAKYYYLLGFDEEPKDISKFYIEFQEKWYSAHGYQYAYLFPYEQTKEILNMNEFPVVAHVAEELKTKFPIKKVESPFLGLDQIQEKTSHSTCIGIGEVSYDDTVICYLFFKKGNSYFELIYPMSWYDDLKFHFPKMYYSETDSYLDLSISEMSWFHPCHIQLDSGISKFGFEWDKSWKKDLFYFCYDTGHCYRIPIISGCKLFRVGYTYDFGTIESFLKLQPFGISVDTHGNMEFMNERKSSGFYVDQPLLGEEYPYDSFCLNLSLIPNHVDQLLLGCCIQNRKRSGIDFTDAQEFSVKILDMDDTTDMDDTIFLKQSFHQFPEKIVSFVFFNGKRMKHGWKFQLVTQGTDKKIQLFDLQEKFQSW